MRNDCKHHATQEGPWPDRSLAETPDSELAIRCNPALVPIPWQAKQQPRLQHRPAQSLEGSRTPQFLGKTQPKVGFLDHVKQTGHWPGRVEVRLECG